MNRSFSRAMALVAIVAMSCVSSAEDVTLGRMGLVRCTFGGGIVFGGLINYDNWKGSAQPVSSVSNATGYVLIGSGGVKFAEGRWMIGGDGAGGVVATNELTITKDVKSQAAGTRVYLPFGAFKGAAWRTDTGETGVFPANGNRQGLFTGRDVRCIALTTTGGEEIVFTFPRNRFVHLSNDADWCNAFSLRLQPPLELKAGDRIEDVFTVAVKDRSLTCASDFRTYSVSGRGWVPLKMLKDVQPGGATDFSGWRLQDAPAGKYGWLRRSDGHFKFEGRPDGECVRFYGVNLVGSCCWPAKDQTDAIVARLVRSGYNAVRLHHIEGDGGITAGTGDPKGVSLNMVTMDRMDYLVAKCIAAGIYVTIDLYSYRTPSPEVRTNMWSAIGRTPSDVVPPFRQMKMLMHLSDEGFENWREYAGNLLTHVNPYTGRAYKDEPGLPLICLVNEGAPTRDWFPSKKATERDVLQIEERSLARMIGFVRSLGAKALITDMNNGPYSPASMAVREKWLDYFDNHFYVDHPTFLGERFKLPYKMRNIDILDYLAPRMSQADVAAAVRLPTMPYTITEWNFSSPGEFRFQSGLYTAALAVNGRWDGLWRFTYAHGVKSLFVSSKSGLGSFDVMLDPIQQATERALVALYLRGDANADADFAKIDREAKMMTVDTPCTKGGFARAGGRFSTSGMSVRLDDAHAAVWATAVDDKPLATTSRILVTHLTDVQNTDTQWAERERKILLKRGGLPLLARAGTAHVILAAAPGDWKAYALGTDGLRIGRVPIVSENGQLKVVLRTARDPSNATLLYELVRN